ncbi:hypothetical protein P280DRAFT_162350 [Massarina eburnea CBS 473.64]|uniref:Uncharacterized protein n=1 Tax=Massarina eburnea CBS 473.64 TaxID=1395130 RepID=A0A6A6RLI7_9PLEO|nr:hypothetical protein P280DRAFT_162350 [Massarina eburnea CBS 473.64]
MTKEKKWDACLVRHARKYLEGLFAIYHDHHDCGSRSLINGYISIDLRIPRRRHAPHGSVPACHQRVARAAIRCCRVCVSALDGIFLFFGGIAHGWRSCWRIVGRDGGAVER